MPELTLREFPGLNALEVESALRWERREAKATYYIENKARQDAKPPFRPQGYPVLSKSLLTKKIVAHQRTYILRAAAAPDGIYG